MISGWRLTATSSRGSSQEDLPSPPPSPEAGVSMPIRWDELGSVYPTDSTIPIVSDRLERTGDSWADILTEKHEYKAMFGSPSLRTE